MTTGTLRVRWLGRVRYEDALALQHALFRRGRDNHLLLLEHEPIYTLGVRARPEHVLFDVDEAEVDVVRADRGGDVTYHGPGQLVGYPILTVAMGPGAIPSYVHAVEQMVIDALERCGLPGTGRVDGYPGVWVDPDGPQARKICAIGVRVARGRTMHGFALNVDPDLAMFDRIVPCGLQRPVTSLAAEGVRVTMAEVVDAIVASAGHMTSTALGGLRVERQDASNADRSNEPTAFVSAASDVVPGSDHAESVPIVLRPGARALERRLAHAGVDPAAGLSVSVRKPAWLRVEARMGKDYLGLNKTMRDLNLVTVCEEAGCPNIYECWSDGTATFMINGERCTRACGFCLVDTRHPLPLDRDEPRRVAEAVARMGLAHAVVTAVARDDLADGGAEAFAETITAIRERRPGTSVEVLIPDCKGDDASLRTIFDAAPDVLNHNLETVLRMQRAVRPSANYARSLSVLGRAKAAGLTVKSGIILGMGETEPEVIGALVDLASVGVDIVTIGQYLRPSVAHLPVARWWTPEEFVRLREIAGAMGFAHVESSPLTRSSYHARDAARAAAGAEISA